MKEAYKIPFDGKGNPMHYPENINYISDGKGGWTPIPPEWRENMPFVATLTYDTYGRGRSSATIHFKDMTGIEYTMFMKDFDAIASLMCFGKITARWKYIKRGQNYGLRMFERITE